MEADKHVTISLSHSQVETFQQCPYRWWLLKRAGIRRAPSEALILGHAVHQAIEADLRSRLSGMHTTNDSNLDSVFLLAIREQFDLDDLTGLISAERRSILEQEGSAVLSIYLQQIALHINPIEVEVPFEFTHPDDPSIIFKGRIDAITQPLHSNHVRTIVDWKVIHKPWMAGEEHRRQQAAAYAWAVACMKWESSPRVTFITFPLLDQIKDMSPQRVMDARPTYPTLDAINHYSRLVKQTAFRIRAMEKSENFLPKIGPLCAWCEVRGACEVGKKALQERGIPPKVPELPSEDNIVPER